MRDENTTSSLAIIKLCNYLKKETFLVQVFSQDRLNEILSIYDNNYLNYKNFNYYKIDNLKFLNNLSFEELRFLNIYSLNQNSRLDINRLKDAQDNYTFQLGFDNYLEYVELIINYDYYDEELVKKFLELE